MTDQTITCPNCSTDIPLSQALSDQVKKELSAELDQEEKQRRKLLEEERKKLEEMQAELKKNEQNLQEKISKGMEEEKRKMWKVAQEKAKEQTSKELKILEEELKEKATKLEKSEEHELEMRKKMRDLEEKEKKMELEIARKMDEERKKIEEQIKKQEQEQNQLKMREKDKQMEILQKTIADLKRQSEQGSMQIQGEVQEDELKEILSSQFVMDDVKDVPTGMKGADLVQHVNGKLGSKSGTIIWESKNTKGFSESWISKLKVDQGKVRADVAILVTQVLPDDIPAFGLKNGVWVVGYQHVVPLAYALRLHLIEMSKIKHSLEGHDEKMTHLYQYLTGPQFKNRIENIVIAFVSMKQDLETEKRSLSRIWNKREKEIEKVLTSTSSMYGDLQGLIGGSLPSIQQLELPELPSAAEEPEPESDQGLFSS